MLARLNALRQIYREETSFDWLVLAADVSGLIIVALAFVHAQGADTAATAVIQIADASLQSVGPLR